MTMFDIAARFIDPSSLLLVCGGCAAVAAARSTREDMRRAAAAIIPFFRARPAEDAKIARRAVRAIELAAEAKGIAWADRIESTNSFARQAALKLADATSAEGFAEWGAAEIGARERRHEAAIAVWRAAADAAPAMGMIGTVVGLIGMFATMDDSAAIGPFMALALLTTLYGLVIGTLFAGSVASRLERLSSAELAWQRDVVRRLEALARAEPGMSTLWLKRPAGSNAR